MFQFTDSSCENSEILKYPMSFCDLSLNYMYSLSKLFPLLLYVLGLSHPAIQKAVGIVRAGVPHLGRDMCGVLVYLLHSFPTHDRWDVSCDWDVLCVFLPLTGCAWHSDALCSECCLFGQTGILLVFWRASRSSWRFAGVESEAGRILLQYFATRVKNAIKKNDETNVNLGHIFERFVINEALRLNRTLTLKAIQLITTNS